MLGGDRVTLKPSNHTVETTTIHHNNRWLLNYAPGVFAGGVGQSVVGCEIFAGPQIAVFFQGNDHTLADSHIHHVGRQCSDCGAFYSGRDWTYRGNIIQRTRFDNLTSIWAAQPSAVYVLNHLILFFSSRSSGCTYHSSVVSFTIRYLDDQLSSVKVQNCVFDDLQGFLLELGGGRHNEFVNNTIRSRGNIHVDDRGGGGSGCASDGKMPYTFLSRVPYNTSKVWSKYPDLPQILQDEPCEPRYNSISNNVLCGLQAISGITPSQMEQWGSVMTNNTVGPPGC